MLLLGVLTMLSADGTAVGLRHCELIFVPAAGFTSMAFIQGRFAYAAQSLLQLVVKLPGVVTAAALILFLAGNSEGL